MADFRTSTVTSEADSGHLKAKSKFTPPTFLFVIPVAIIFVAMTYFFLNV